MDKISVIVTVFNKEDYIVRCIQSVYNQSYDNWELIVIDDGSTDTSQELITINSNKNNKVNILLKERNEGLAIARNHGLKMATGDQIFFLDADDYLLPDALSMLSVMSNVNDSPMIALRVQGSHKLKPIDSLNVRTFKWKGSRKSKVYSRKSVASILIRRSFIENNNLYFDDQYQYLTDFDFLLRSVDLVERIVYVNLPLYIRGECIDPIEKPAMSLEPIENYLEEYKLLVSNRKSYQRIINEEEGITLPSPIDNVNYIEKLFLRLYFKEISFVAIESEDYFKKQFEELKSILSTFDAKLRNRSGKIGVLQLKAHLGGDYKKTISWIKRRKSLSGWKLALKNRQQLYRQIGTQIFTKLPIKNKQIVFESFGGKSYSCSPRAIYEELQRVDPSYTCVWAFNDPSSKEIVGNGKKVKRLSLRYYYYMATSKYWVINARVPKYIKKRDETEYVQTWHGTPLKRLAADMKEVHMPGTSTSTYKKNFYEEAQRWDYLVSPNDYSTEIFKRAFHFNKEVLDVGYPRNDLFYKEEINNPTSIANLKERIGLPSDKKVILYAPTWRDDEFYGKGEYKFDIKLDLFDMKKRLGDEYVVVLRMHYLIADNLNVDGLEGFAYNFSDYDDIAELYLVSDILITDYSSVFFDYANLNRPILFYTYDLDKYRNDLRGFYIDFEQEAPGPILLESEQVIDSIERINEVQEEYRVVVTNFKSKFCHLDDGLAAKKIIKNVLL
ncbi:bifunctional glycosyltransferase/CDP-glycerol:glycerophosphate glycerophosphotransferase [Alkalicoccobacillus gibsonii]|uniref:bifunctional glycosyltransferase/CDP-glycerol:glycerophosphate glycerophosphotransferase n=1 Tax=Alkalicoccobacillus gibsonii TaxID=79881 RepID=UPI003F7C0B9E